MNDASGPSGPDLQSVRDEMERLDARIRPIAKAPISWTLVLSGLPGAHPLDQADVRRRDLHGRQPVRHGLGAGLAALAPLPEWHQRFFSSRAATVRPNP